MDTQVEAQTPRPVAVYFRVSPVTHSRQPSLAAQREEACRAFAEFKGRKVVHVFYDVCGGNDPNRPAFDRLLDAIALTPQPMDVIVYSHPCLARTVKGFLHRLAAIRATGATVDSPNFDYGDAAERLVAHVLAAVEEHHDKLEFREAAAEILGTAGEASGADTDVRGK